MLSIDSLLNVVAALEKLTDVAVGDTVITPEASSGPPTQPKSSTATLLCCITEVASLHTASRIVASKFSLLQLHGGAGHCWQLAPALGAV